MVWQMAQDIGYTPITTFWEDFSIAEQFGTDAIKDTAKRIFDEWHDNIKYLTEFIMVLNHKCWTWNKKNEKLMELYSHLFLKYNDKAWDWLEANGTQEDKSYYFHTLD